MRFPSFKVMSIVTLITAFVAAIVGLAGKNRRGFIPKGEDLFETDKPWS